jgi:SAM-dependent methyltransferase
MSSSSKSYYGAVFGGRARDDEYERLRCLAEDLDPATERRLAALRPRASWRCLEIGAGTGTIAAWMAGRCTEGRVVATDVDLRFLPDVPGPRLELRRHDVTVDDFPAGSFDLVHARWVFAHLRDRERTLRRVASWLAPGGWLMLEEPARFPVESSASAAYRDVFLAHLDGWCATHIGTDTEWPRGFPEPLARLGLSGIGLEVTCSLVGAGRPMARFFAQVLRHAGPAMIDAGQVSRTDIDRFVGLMYRPDFHDLAVATVAAWGRRPGYGPTERAA